MPCHVSNSSEVSTAETRQEAAKKLRQFFLDPRVQRWPPPDIALKDLGDAPVALDDYLKDEHIAEILEETFVVSELDGSFYEKYPEFSRLCWGNEHRSEFADHLGIPRMI